MHVRVPARCTCALSIMGLLAHVLYVFVGLLLWLWVCRAWLAVCVCVCVCGCVWLCVAVCGCVAVCVSVAVWHGTCIRHDRIRDERNIRISCHQRSGRRGSGGVPTQVQ